MDQAPKGELSIKGYRKSCTGKALETAEQHSQAVDPDGLILFGACFSPFVQMVWVALEELKVPYQVSERRVFRKYLICPLRPLKLFGNI